MPRNPYERRSEQGAPSDKPGLFLEWWWRIIVREVREVYHREVREESEFMCVWVNH